MPAGSPRIWLAANAVWMKPITRPRCPGSKLRSFGAHPELARAFRDYTRRWKEAAFDGRMGIAFGKDMLDLDTVVHAWFNSDLFHTAPQRPETLTLDGLSKLLGGLRHRSTIRQSVHASPDNADS